MEKLIEWDKDKNEVLKKERGISFEEIEEKIINKEFIDDKRHYNKLKYPHQKVFYFQINNYIYTVPYVIDGNKIFLKTIIPSRKETKKYLKNKFKNES